MPELIAAESMPFINEGLYLGTVAEIEDDPSGKFGPQFKFVWTLDGQYHDQGDKEGQPIQQWDWCSQKLTPKSKLWSVAVTLGKTPVLGQPLNTDDLLGKKAQLVIKHIDTASGPKARIVDMMKIAGVAPTAAPAATEPPEMCVVCARKGKQVPLAHYGPEGEPLCAAHDEDDL